MTQAGRVLAALEQAGTRGVCANDFIYRMRPGIPRVAARIHQLRDEGWRIVTERCDLHPHVDPDTGKATRAVKYRLEGGRG